MRRVPVATRTVEDEMGRTRQFCYDLVIDMEETHQFACEHYGVAVIEPGGDDTIIQAITPRAERIDELLTLLVEQRVGPTTLRDVVMDWL